MKKIAYLLVAGGLALTACNNEPSYKITGTVAGVEDGETIYLQEQKGRELVNLDSAIVKNGTFTFTGRQDTTVHRYIVYEPGEMWVDLFLENGNIAVNLTEEKVSGTANNDIYQTQFKEFLATVNEALGVLHNQLRSDSTLTEEQRKTIADQIEAKNEEAFNGMYQVVENNISNPVGIYLLPQVIGNFEFDQQVALVDKVPAHYREVENIARVIQQIELTKKTAVGQKYIDFAMNNPEGKEVKLSDYISKNKYTLIDFWASWCGPCKREMPNVIAAYKAYSKKGFGIVGVSLDNDEAAWKEAIKTWGMTWPQMSDLKGWACEGSKLYGVNAIPATVLVDQEGTIIARNLRGEAIQEKLSELLK